MSSAFGNAGFTVVTGSTGAAQDPVEDDGRGGTGERQPPGHHLVENDAKGEQVRSGVERFTAGLLGGHVGDGPDHATGVRDEICRLGLDVFGGRVLDPGDAEVENLRIAAMGHEDVGRLDIAVDDALGVRGFKRIGELHTEAERVIEPERAAHEQVAEHVPLEQLHHDERRVAVLAQVVDGADVGMIQGRRGPRLALEAGQVLAAGETRRERLDRDFSSELGIARPIHLTHSAFAKRRQDFVVLEARASGPGTLATIMVQAEQDARYFFVLVGYFANISATTSSMVTLILSGARSIGLSTRAR